MIFSYFNSLSSLCKLIDLCIITTLHPSFKREIVSQFDFFEALSELSQCSNGSLLLCHAASSPHHPERRPGDCDEAGDHPGIRQTPGPAWQRGQRLRLLRASGQVEEAAWQEESFGSVKGRHSKCNCPTEYLYSSYFLIMLYYICT